MDFAPGPVDDSHPGRRRFKLPPEVGPLGGRRGEQKRSERPLLPLFFVFGSSCGLIPTRMNRIFFGRSSRGELTPQIYRLALGDEC